MKPLIKSSARLLALLTALATATPLLATPPAQFSSSLTHGGTTVAVNYSLHPIRGAGFQVLVQDSGGDLNAVPAPEARTYIGTVTGYPGATACALLQPDNSTAWEYVILRRATNGGRPMAPSPTPMAARSSPRHGRHPRW